MYIELIKKVLLDYHRTGMEYKPLLSIDNHWKVTLLKKLDTYLRTKGFAVTRLNPYKNFDNRTRRWWPINAETMIGMKRMDNIEYCVKDVLANNIEGDFVECGVWRGGATILMKAILASLGKKRTVWVTDSFAGLPKPDKKYESDAGDHLYIYDELAIPLEEVQENFRKYGLLDDDVKFLKGWFKDTLPTAPIEKIAVLRADGDMYESTINILDNLYPKLVKGGYCIIDDYNMLPNCRQAVEDYRKEHGITDEIIPIDDEGVYWKKT